MIIQILTEDEAQCLQEMRRNGVVSYHGLRESDIIECPDDSFLAKLVHVALQEKREKMA